MRTAIVLGCVLLLAGSASGQLALYWLPDIGCVKGLPEGETFQSETPLTLVDAFPEGWIRYYYSLDADGDLCLGSQSQYIPAVFMGVQTTTFDPPLKTLDYPLDMGKTWHAESMRSFSSGAMSRSITLDGTVVGPQVVNTILGPLTVIEVTLTLTDYQGTAVQHHLLHDQIGEVTGMVSWDCPIVATEDQTWGGVKSLYR